MDLSCPKFTKEKPKSLLIIENILAYELVCHAFVIFDIFVKTDFPVPIFCLKLLKWTCYVQYIPNRSNRNSNWLKIYWPTSKYASVWARTPCIFFYIFQFGKKRLSCAYQLSKLSKWTYYVQNVPNRCQRTLNYFKIYWRTSSYAVHFWPVQFLGHSSFVCKFGHIILFAYLYQPNICTKHTTYDT